MLYTVSFFPDLHNSISLLSSPLLVMSSCPRGQYFTDIFLDLGHQGFGRRHMCLDKRLVSLCGSKCSRSDSTWPRAKREMISLTEKISLMNGSKKQPKGEGMKQPWRFLRLLAPDRLLKTSRIGGRQVISFPLRYWYFNTFLPLEWVSISHTSCTEQSPFSFEEVNTISLELY